MRSKKFTLDFACDEGTRWFIEDQDLANHLATFLRGVAHTWTAGPVPAVTVTEISQADLDGGKATT